MRAVEDCAKFFKPITKVTKANSFVASGRTIYLVKKDYEGNTVKAYCAYDKETGIFLGGHWDKDYLIEFMSKQDLSCLGTTGQLTLF